MEYIALGDLDKNLKSGTLGEPEAKEIGHQILTGLNIMHLESFAHRDLKPQVSVSLVTMYWQPKLIIWTI